MRMLSHLKKQNGVTLVELLAAITIASFLLAILFTVLFNGINYSNKAQQKARLQNEANYILTVLTNELESMEEYTIKLDIDPEKSPKATSITITTTSDGKSTKISNANYYYTLFDVSDDIETAIINTITVDPKTNNDSDESIKTYLPIKLIVEDKEDPSIFFETKTIISLM